MRLLLILILLLAPTQASHAFTKCYSRNGEVFVTNQETCPEGYTLDDPLVEDMKGEYGPTVLYIRLGMTPRRLVSAFPGKMRTSETEFDCIDSVRVGAGTAHLVFGNFTNGRVSRVDGTFDVSIFDSVVESLTEKLGKPSRTKTDDVQNRLGAHFTDAKHWWDFADGSMLFLHRYSSDLVTSAVLLWTKEEREKPLTKKTPKEVNGF